MAYTPPPAGASSSVRGLIKLAGDLTGTADVPTVTNVARANNGGQETVSTNSAASGAVTLNLANGNVFSLTLTGNITPNVTGAVAGKACSFALYLKQDAVGNRTVTWTTMSPMWAGGIAPTLSTAANAVDVVVFESIDGGTNWFGSLVGTAFA